MFSFVHGALLHPTPWKDPKASEAACLYLDANRECGSAEHSKSRVVAETHHYRTKLATELI
jgi:hypothetical protein